MSLILFWTEASLRFVWPFWNLILPWEIEFVSISFDEIYSHIVDLVRKNLIHQFECIFFSRDLTGDSLFRYVDRIELSWNGVPKINSCSRSFTRRNDFIKQIPWQIWTSVNLNWMFILWPFALLRDSVVFSKY